MKCPKCDYLSFDTGARCKNCGYDFSLTPSAPPRGSALPLFTLPAETDDDEPLVKLPAAPRPPLSVRKTPETPRLRAVPRPRRAEPEPALIFAEESAPDPDLRFRDEPLEAPIAPPPPREAAARQPAEAGRAGARLGAVLIDHAILLAIDVAVVYFTLRMASLSPAEWTMLPAAPLLAFLVLVKFAYFAAFTAVGGQTIGKMALNIRVVTDDDGPVDAACAIRRTIAGVVSSLVLGLGFLPALFGGDRRALHDRVAHTRVVARRPA